MEKIPKKYLKLALINSTISLCIIITIYNKALAQVPGIEWQKSYGGTSWDSYSSALKLKDNTYVVLGGSNSNDFDVNGNHGDDNWIVKLDSTGTIINQMCIGGSSTDIFYNLDTLGNGHLLFVGTTMSNDGDVSGNHLQGTFDAWIVETDSEFNLIRQKCFGGTNHDGFTNLAKCPNNSFILAGYSVSSDGDLVGQLNHGNGDAWVLKIDSSWNIQWQKCYGGSYEDAALSIFTKPDSTYTLSCYSGSFDGNISSPIGGYDFWISKLDSVGNIIWDKSYGGTSDEILTSVTTTNDNGYVLAGRTNSHDGYVSSSHDTIFSVNDYWVLKLDSMGNFEWQRCLGGTREDEASSIIKDYDNGFIVTGYTSSDDDDISGIHTGGCVPYSCEDIWMTKIDSVGSLIWQKCFGGSQSDLGYNCLLVGQGGYLIVGNTFSIDGDLTGNINHGNGDAWAIKLSTFSNVIRSPENHSDGIFIWVENKNNKNQIHIDSEKNSTQVEIFDLTGRMLFSQQFSFGKGVIETEDWAGGMYLVALKTNRGVITKKLIINSLY